MRSIHSPAGLAVFPTEERRVVAPPLGVLVAGDPIPRAFKEGTDM